MPFENFPYSDYHSLNLDWIMKKVKEAVEKSDLTAEEQDALKTYVDTFFANLDTDAVITDIINQMAADGELAAIMRPLLSVMASEWLSENITNPSNPPLDASLTVANAAADAQAAGNAIRANELQITNSNKLLQPGSNLVSLLTQAGSLSYADGEEINTSTAQNAFARSDYIYLTQGSVIHYIRTRNLSTSAVIAVYTTNKVYDAENSVRGSGSTYRQNGFFTMPYNGYIRMCTHKSTISEIDIWYNRPRLNILAMGNSFTQDSFAYLPPVLNELLPEYDITYCVGYTSSGSITNQVDLIDNDGVFTVLNYWRAGATSWTRWLGGGSNEKHFSDAIPLADKWDIVYLQPASSLSEPAFTDNVITPAREFLRRMQRILGYPFTFIMGQWLVPTSSLFPTMAAQMEHLREAVGVNEVWPIGTGIENARTNMYFQALGDGGNMTFDGQHQQSGIPALISTYVVAECFMRYLRRNGNSIYSASWIPTDDNTIAINAQNSTGWDPAPHPMTHGWSVGIDNAGLNVKAAQEIAILAVNNPGSISDCSGIIIGDGVNNP